jgi:hypothetical protein
MNVKEILAQIPESLLDELSAKSKTDKYAKKLKGSIVFKLLVHCILTHKDNSLRRMSSSFENIFFSYLNGESKSISYSSISERLSTMNPDFFKAVYENCLEVFCKTLDVQNTPIKYDSTIVSLSSKLLFNGYNLKGGDASKLNLIKYTIGLTEFPVVANIYTEQSYNSENKALGNTVKEDLKNKELVKVFDRGITSREIYDEMIEKKMLFVSRVNTGCKHKVVIENRLSEKIAHKKLIIYSDETVYLYSQYHRSKHSLRLIKTIKKEDDEEVWFITSIEDASPEDITDIYKKRWEIEVFFKFLKQELNFSHFLNRSKNGITIILYCTLIASILLLVYKTRNNIKGYKIMKQRFLQELEYDLIKEIIILSGGDIEKIKFLEPKPK